MNKLATIDGIAERLRVIAEADAAGQIAEQAQRLLARLNAPVRVVILGFPGAGKLGLLNALVAGPALPDAAKAVTVELRYGAIEGTEITCSDGSVMHCEGAIEPDDLTDAAFLVIERPLPVLKRISFLNLVADADPAEQKAAIAWAARRTDIALWSSPRFGPYDREVWTQVPDRVRDHAFLVLTGCDGEKAADIKARHRSDFIDVYSVDLRTADGSVVESGVAELADRVTYHADLGRRADLDSAMLFLKAHEPRPQTRPRPQSKPRPLTKPRPHTRSRPVTRPVTETPAVVPATEPIAPQSGATAKTSEPLPDALFRSGFTYLRDRGAALLGNVRREAGSPCPEIVAHCSETLRHLSDIIAEHEDGGVPSVTWLADTVMEAENLVILLENESGEDAAIDAVSLLLQVRRDFEARLAA